MRNEEIVIGEWYYYQNRPFQPILRIGDSDYYQGELHFNLDAEKFDLQGQYWCMACMCGNSDYKGRHTCNDAQEIIDEVVDRVLDKELITVNVEHIKPYPIEYEKNEALITCIQNNIQEKKRLEDQIITIYQKFREAEVESRKLELYLKNNIASLKKEYNVLEEEVSELRKNRDYLSGQIKVGKDKKISLGDMLEFVEAYFRLSALEAGGVDNWQWYSESIGDRDFKEEAMDYLFSLK